MVCGSDRRRRKADGAAAWSSFDGGNVRWCRAPGQHPRWRNPAIDRRRLDVAAHDRHRERRSSGLRASEPPRSRDRGGGEGPLRESGCRGDMDYRRPRASRSSLLCRCFWEKRHFRVGIYRPVRAAGRSIPASDRRQRSTSAFGGRHAEVDRRQSRYRLHRNPRFDGRRDRPIGTPLRFARRRRLLVAFT